MNKFLHSSLILLLSLLFVNFNSNAAGWEQIRQQYGALAFHIADDGTMILADYLFDGSGGIYISEDNGENWTKVDVPDYTYKFFVETDEYIFAGGGSAKVARSADNGRTWEVMSYADALKGTVVEGQEEYTVTYGMTMHDGKLFVADFSGGGVVYSADNGETWHQTDVESFKYGEVDPELGDRFTESLYNVVSYNGNLYAFGVYFVFKMDNETMKWEAVRNDSNFLVISTMYKGKMCCGRSIMNETADVAFILTLDEEENWGEIPRPEGFIDNNIRAMHGDGDALYVGMTFRGIKYTENEGKDWTDISEGLVSYGESELGKSYDVPLVITTDDEYVYMVIYRDPNNDYSDVSGLYRLSKSELPSSSVDTVEANEEFVMVTDSSIILSKEVLSFNLYDLNGQKVVGIRQDSNQVSIENIPRGIYIYRIETEDKILTGKIKK